MARRDEASPPGPPGAEAEVQVPEFSRRRLIAGLLVVGGLAISGVAIGMAGRGGFDVLRQARPPDLRFLALAFGIAVFDVAIGAYRIHNLAHRLASSVKMTDCFRAELANRCLAGITPWQTGGGGAQLYVLARAGLRLSGGVAVGTLNFLVSTIILVVFGFTTLAFLKGSLPTWLQVSTRATIGALIGLLVLSAIVLWFPDKGALQKKQHGGRFKKALRAARRFIHHSLETARRMLRLHRGSVFMIFPITAVIFVTKMAYTWAVFRAFQPTGHFDDMLGVLVILILALLFAPTPGASGVAEASATAFLADSLGPAGSIGFVLYWRMLTLYLPVALGGIVLLHQLDRDSRRMRAASRREKDPRGESS